ncbi:MAG: hypothetical protein IPN49_12720 [Saprospiraceae bacterium]|nr:hypothetical protein [Saprospiraceae bacterium]
MKGKFKKIVMPNPSQMVLLKSKNGPKNGNTYTYPKLISNGKSLYVCCRPTFGSAGINGEKCLTSVFKPTPLKWATFFSLSGS